MTFFFLLAIFIVLLLAAFPSAKHVVPEGSRLVVLRLGRFLYLGHPGLHIIIPYIDKAILVDITKEVAGHSMMNSQEIGDKIVEGRFGTEVLQSWISRGRPMVRKN